MGGGWGRMGRRLAFASIPALFGVHRPMSDPLSQPSAAPNTDPYEDFELPVAGFTGTPEEIEQQWYEKVYLGRGDTLPQLTVRAVVMGSILGGILSLTNLYIGLKTGWGF